MLTKVQKWGNSQGIRIPLRLMQEAKLAIGDEVDVTVQQGRIIVVPSECIHGRCRLKDLVARMPEGYEPFEKDWGAPVGREVW